MAIKYTYPRKAVPSNGDLILISDSVDNNKTKTISIDTLPGGGSTGVFSIFSTNGVSTGIQDALSLDSNTGSVTFSINKYDGGDNAGYVPPGGTGSTYLRGDGTWGTPASGFSIEYEGSALASDPSLINFTGPGVVATENAGEVTVDISGSTTVENVRISEQVSKGDALYVSGQGFGSNPGIPTVGIADATDDAKMPAVGIALEDYSQNTTGKMIITGVLEDINTNVITGASGSSINEIVYIDNTGSTNNLTIVKPINTDLIQNVGIITKTGANGSIQVSCIGRTNDLPNIPQGSIWIGDNDGVPEQLGIGTSGQVLTSNGLSAEWSGSAFVSTINFGTTGLTPNTDTGGVVDVDGTLVAANGGTGFSSYNVGDILYANSTTSLTKLGMSAPDAGKVLAVNSTGDAPEWVTQSGISEVTADAPIVVTNGTTAPDISIPEADTLADGYLSSTWWNNFKVSGDVGQLQFTDATGNAFDSGKLKHIKVSGNDQGGFPTSITTLEIGASTDNLNGGVLKLYGSNFSGAAGLNNDSAAIEFVNASATNTLRLRANPSADYTITLPSAAPTGNRILQSNASGDLSWVVTPTTPAPGNAGDVQFTTGASAQDFTRDEGFNFTTSGNDKILQLANTGTTNKRGILKLSGYFTSGEFPITTPASIQFLTQQPSPNPSKVVTLSSYTTEDYNIKLPLVAPANDQILQSDTNGQLSWVNTPTGGLTPTPASGNYTASAGEMVLVDTSSSAQGLVVLPSPTTNGETIGVKWIDYTSYTTDSVLVKASNLGELIDGFDRTSTPANYLQLGSVNTYYEFIAHVYIDGLNTVKLWYIK